MKELLMDKYDDFIKSYDEPKTTGLRINTLKINKEELLNLNLYNLTPIPWADEGFPGTLAGFHEGGSCGSQHPAPVRPDDPFGAPVVLMDGMPSRIWRN